TRERDRAARQQAQARGGIGVMRYRVRCRYEGEEAFKTEAVAFVCGVVAATLGADVNYEDHDGPTFDVLILESAISPDPARLGYWRQISAANLARMLWTGCSVEIGTPEATERSEPEASA